MRASIGFHKPPAFTRAVPAISCRGVSLVTKCPNRMTKQRSEDQWDKEEKRRERTSAGVFEREDTKHHNPCSDRHWSGIAGPPRLVGAGQHTERQCRDETKLGKRPHKSAEFDLFGSFDDTFEVNRVDDHENAKQTEILEYLALIDPKRRNVAVCAVFYQRNSSQ